MDNALCCCALQDLVECEHPQCQGILEHEKISFHFACLKIRLGIRLERNKKKEREETIRWNVLCCVLYSCVMSVDLS